MGQSTNDMFPTAIHVAVALAITHAADSRPASGCTRRWPTRPQQWDKIIKIGRTHLADATPLRLGQEFGGFARQLELSVERAERAIEAVLGTARRRHGRRHGHQHASRVRPPRRRSARQGDRHPVRRGRRTTSRPTPSATDSSSATASCGRSPPRCSTSPTTSAGSAPARAAGSTKCSCPTASPAARSCPARSIP